MPSPPQSGDLLATLCGADEGAALGMVERLGCVFDEQYSKGVDAAVSALVTSLEAARSPAVRAACVRAVSKLRCWPDSPAGPINMDEAGRVLVALCQAIRVEREQDVRLAIIDAIEAQAPYRTAGPDPDAVDNLLLECAASNDVAERHAAQRALLFRIHNTPDSDYGVGDEAILRKAFARDRREFAAFLAQNSANEKMEWSRLLKVGETPLGWVEDAIGPPDDPPYVELRRPTTPSIWKYDLGHPTNLLFVFRFDPTNGWRLKSSGYE